MSLTISVVVPCYNGEAFLAEALESVRRQTRPACEVIVVDDGSTDGSVALARRLDGVTMLGTPGRSGAGAARNVGTRAARGDVIAWLDADDRWEPTHLASIAELLERHPEAAVAFSGARQFGAKSEEWPALIPEEEVTDPFWTAIRRCLSLPSATAVRRDALLDAGGFDESLRVAEDFELWVRLARRGIRFVCTHAVTVDWRQHGANTGADLRRYQQNEYLVRHRLWAAAASTPGEEHFAARLGEALTDTWESNLRVAWYMRSVGDTRFHLSMRALVPGSAAHVGAWRRRALLVPFLPALDRARAAARRLLGPRRTPAER